MGQYNEGFSPEKNLNSVDVISCVLVPFYRWIDAFIWIIFTHEFSPPSFRQKNTKTVYVGRAVYIQSLSMTPYISLCLVFQSTISAKEIAMIHVGYTLLESKQCFTRISISYFIRELLIIKTLVKSNFRHYWDRMQNLGMAYNS